MRRTRLMRRLSLSFTVTLLSAFALVFALGTGAVVMVFRAAGQEAAILTAEAALAQAAKLVAARSQALFAPVLASATLLPDVAPLTAPFPDDDPAQRGDVTALLDLLALEPAVQGISVGLADGTLRQVLRSAALAAHLPAPPPGSVTALRQADAAGDHWTFLDARRAVLERALRPAGGTDPRFLPWYRQASADGAVQVAPLGDLPLFGRPGLSISKAIPGGAGVLALDVTLERLSAFLATQRVSANATLFLFDAEGMLLAHQDPARAVVALGEGRTGWLALSGARDPLLRAFWEAYAQGALRPGEDARLTLGEAALLLRIEPVADIAGTPLLAVVAAPVSDFTGPVLASLRRGTAWAIGALLLGLGGIGLLAWRVAIPLGRLTREAEAIRRFDLDSPIEILSHITEVQRLGGAMAAMKSALGNFAAYVPRDLVRQLVGAGEAARLGGDRRPLTVMFSDVQGFTDLAEPLEPEEVMRLTSAYFEALTLRLQADGATIDKFIGDAVMAFWNAPRRDVRHASLACLAVLRARQTSQRLEGEFRARGWPALVTRFGLHSGEAVVGNVGSSDRLSYTAIGSMVNLASRLEGLNKHYGTAILLSEATRRAAGPAFLCRPVDLVLPKGARQPIEIFELLGLAEPSVPADAALSVPPALRGGLAAWGQAVAEYRLGRFAAALASLDSLEGAGQDPLHAAYRARLEALLASPPGPDWSPVIRFDAK
jgi:adenylate cyclase